MLKTDTMDRNSFPKRFFYSTENVKVPLFYKRFDAWERHARVGLIMG